MTLTAGSRLGPYEIVVPLGAGGMGEVYRARDTRLGREVAIKVLPAELSSDKERLHRFEQEARAASALNHPNIVTVHDIGEADSAPYIAMELVEGKTVRELIVPGPLPVRKLLAVAAQVAEGLAKAHTAGIVHRDLKPENLMVSSDGFVKILDFGLAKLVANSAEGLSRVPTVARPETHPGTLLGTVGYMSPEQAAGQPLDFRSDQFSFGSILYEMATGKRAFGRPTTVDTLAAILHDEPEPIGRANDSIPAPLRWIVERCLEKDPRARYAATLDLARDLSSVREHISEVSGEEAALSPGTRRRRGALLSWGLAGTALLAGFVSGYFLRGRQNEASPVPALVRLNLAFPPEESLAFGGWPLLALSPDGRRLVYAGRRGEEQRVLYVRPLDGLEATPIPGTEGALNPFFSPDGEWVGFGADGKLKKISLAGGPSLTLCEAALLRGASWGADGTILFSPSGSASLYRVSDKGGQPRAVTTLDAKKGERTHRWPDILPGGEAALFTIHGLSGNYDDARIGAVSLATGQRRVLFEGGTDARYVPSGHIVYLRGGALFAISFDAKRLEVTGSPVPVVDGIGQYGAAGVGHYAFSKTGSLVYAQRDPRAFEGELVWMDRKGGQRLLTEVRRAYAGPRFSPDGRRLAVASDGSVIWIYDIARSSWEQLASGGINYAPVWSPDGKRLMFSSNRDGSIDLYVMPADRSTPPEQLTRTKTWPVASSWSPDGRSVLVGEQNWATGADLSQLALYGDLEVRPLLATPAHEDAARLSPDGRWMAYQSNESGRSEVYVAPYPGSGGRSLVSTNGGTNPVWSPDGRELFFRSGKQLMAATIEKAPELRAGVPRALFDAPFEDFDVAPDGQRFVMVRPAHPDLPPPPLAVVLGWFGDLERRLKIQE